MVGILAAARRSRSNRRRDPRSLRERVTGFLTTGPKRTADDPDADVVAPPQLSVPRVLAWLGMALCLALLGTLVMSLDNYTVRTRQFQVRDFQVIGNHHLDAETVIAAAGVTEGNDLFKVDLAAIRARLEALPWVRQAKADKQLPGRLVLTVEEYVPVVLVAGGELVLADDSCHLIDRPDAGAHDKLPVVTGISIADLRRDPPNAATLLARRRLRRAIALVGAWPHEERFTLGEVNWDAVRGLTLLSADDGAEIRIGHARDEELDRRFRQIDALLADLERRGQRLRYALMDDPAHPGRAVVRSEDVGKWRPLHRAARKAAGPARPRAPQEPWSKADQTNTNKRAGARRQQQSTGGR